MFQPDVGVIDAERAMVAMRALAEAHGVQIHDLDPDPVGELTCLYTSTATEDFILDRRVRSWSARPARATAPSSPPSPARWPPTWPAEVHPPIRVSPSPPTVPEPRCLSHGWAAAEPRCLSHGA